MENLHIENIKIIKEDGVEENSSIWIENGRISSYKDGVIYKTLNGTGLTALPGFFDTHIHGFGGNGTEDGNPESILKMSEELAKTGVTSFFPTIYTDTQKRILRDIKAIVDAIGRERGAAIAGIHVEGPFISPDRIGAQNPEGRLHPDEEAMRNMISAGKGYIRAMTMAPEVDGIDKIAKLAKENSIKCLIGHTNATYEETIKGHKLGISHATHLFNAMSGLHHRNPGVVGAVLSEKDITAEVIGDGRHVAPATFKAVFNAKGRDSITVVTDSLRPTLQKEGPFTANGVEVEMGPGLWVTKGRPELIQGSCLSMDQALRNLISWGFDIVDASYMLSTAPAKLYGFKDRGLIKDGLRADLAIVDESLNIKYTIVEGEIKNVV